MFELCNDSFKNFINECNDIAYLNAIFLVLQTIQLAAMQDEDDDLDKRCDERIGWLNERIEALEEEEGM